MNKTKSKTCFLGVVCLLILSSGHSFADEPALAPLTSLAFLNRCYSHLTQMKLSANHPLRMLVSTGALSPLEACMRLLDGAALNPSGANEGLLQQQTTDSKAVLHTFNDFHRSWFPNDNLQQAVAESGIAVERISMLYDSGEAALHVTRALFTPGINYSEVVTANSGVEALRSSNAINGTSIPEAFPFAGEIVQTGQLLGVRQITSNPNKKNVSASLIMTDSSGNKTNFTVPMHQSYGGGVLGLQQYLQLNFGRKFTEKMNGGNLMPRRWAKAVLSDLMCRTIPVLRLGDVQAYVQADSLVTAKTPLYRLSSTCMSCHATMDNMAGVARNLSTSLVADVNHVPTEHFLTAMMSFPVSMPREAGQVDDDPNFNLRPPTGRLFFRDAQGKLVNQAVTGFNGLGQAIANTDDFYICAASRYLKFFTGIQVNLTDPGDPSHEIFSTEELAYRDLAIKLGLDLKSGQNLKAIIRKILESDIYQNASMRAFGPVSEGN